jgi:hypothetical protein
MRLLVIHPFSGLMRLLILLPLVFVTACSAFRVSEDDLPPANLAVSITEAPAETEFAVEGGEGSVIVEDRAVSGVCHRDANHGAYLEDGVVTLWLSATGREGRVCPQMQVESPFRATITGIDPGTYRVRLLYIGSIDTATRPRPDLEGVVVVS